MEFKPLIHHSISAVTSEGGRNMVADNYECAQGKFYSVLVHGY